MDGRALKKSLKEIQEKVIQEQRKKKTQFTQIDQTIEIIGFSNSIGYSADTGFTVKEVSIPY